MPDVVIVLTTAPSTAVGETLARLLVDGQAAACVNVLPPMVSIYRWKGEVHRESECQLVIKTERGALDRVQRLLREHHPYEVPECLVVDVESGDPAYVEWVAGQTQGDAKQ